MARGSKPGERRGGRQQGTPNRKTAETVAAVESSGLTPLEYMLSVLRDARNEQAVRLDAAHKAAPYVHAKLASIDVGNKDDKPFEQVFRWAQSQDEATHDPSKQ